MNNSDKHCVMIPKEKQTCESLNRHLKGLEALIQDFEQRLLYAKDHAKQIRKLIEDHQ